LDSPGLGQVASSVPPSSSPFFDVERYRSEPTRLVAVRAVSSTTLVLGSTQSSGVVSDAAAQRAGVTVQRRRGGGGAVLLRPGDHLWLDAWIPRADPLWAHDVSAAADWAGSWWSAALSGLGWAGLTVHRGRAEAGELGSLVCFAGRGPGEVFVGGRKIVGLSQWRAREGALFSSCAYTYWEPDLLAGLLVAGGGTWGTGERLDRSSLESVAVGVLEVDGGPPHLGPLRDALLGSFPDLG
jgi:lipoate---protein ligase